MPTFKKTISNTKLLSEHYFNENKIVQSESLSKIAKVLESFYKLSEDVGQSCEIKGLIKYKNEPEKFSAALSALLQKVGAHTCENYEASADCWQITLDSGILVPIKYYVEMDRQAVNKVQQTSNGTIFSTTEIVKIIKARYIKINPKMLSKLSDSEYNSEIVNKVLPLFVTSALNTVSRSNIGDMLIILLIVVGGIAGIAGAFQSGEGNDKGRSIIGVGLGLATIIGLYLYQQHMFKKYLQRTKKFVEERTGCHVSEELLQRLVNTVNDAYGAHR